MERNAKQATRKLGIDEVRSVYSGKHGYAAGRDAADPKPVLKDGELYLGDNGRALCGAHSGMSARYTGRDLSGQRVLRVTDAVARAEGMTIRCERAGCIVARG